MMFCLGQGLKGGPRAALAADAGIALGAMIHVLIAGLGLGAVVAASPLAFDVIRWVGGVYLLWLAWGSRLTQRITLIALRLLDIRRRSLMGCLGPLWVLSLSYGFIPGNNGFCLY